MTRANLDVITHQDYDDAVMTLNSLRKNQLPEFVREWAYNKLRGVRLAADPDPIVPSLVLATALIFARTTNRSVIAKAKQSGDTSYLDQMYHWQLARVVTAVSP